MTARIAAEKRALRLEMRRRLAGVDHDARRAGSASAAERALALPELAGARGVLVFLSFGDEIETSPLIAGLEHLGVDLCVPRLERAGRPLEVCRFPCPLERSSFGIDQPEASVPALSDSEIAGVLDVVVVPGLAFDPARRRLGYGAGTFDRFLDRHRMFTLGFALDLQVVPRVPVESHDVPLDRIVTERRTVGGS